MPDIHISIPDVERLRGDLRAAKTQVEASVKKVEDSLRSADWNDANSKSFGQQLAAAKRGTKAFTAEADQLDRFLGRVLDQAKRMKQG